MTWQVLKIAVDALSRNKARSLLTMLGIIIGVSSVIAMVSLGQGAQQQVQEQISSMGTNMLIVQSGSQRSAGVRGGAGSTTTLTPEDFEAIQREASSVAAVSPTVNTNVTVVAGNQNWSTRGEGVAPGYLTIRNRAVADGTFFTDADVKSAVRVAVLGKTVADTLFPGGEAVGQTIRVRNLPFKVVGVLEAKGQSQMGQDQDDTILMPYTTVMKKLNAVTYVSSGAVSAKSAEATAQAQAEIEAILRAGHNIRNGQEDDFTVRNLTELADAAQSTSRVLTLLLGCVAGVSLLVGGIGIMNIMLVSVTERTREIGIRMAVGARTHHVRNQFLIEALILGLAGGLIGVLGGIAVSFTIAIVFGWPQLLSPTAMIGSSLFSMAIGVFFGYYPARKAAELDPIEALRFE
jgi:putative ABC transport system permease protein